LLNTCLKCNKPNLGELDRQRRINEEKDCKFWYDLYKTTYLTLQKYNKNKNLNLDLNTIKQVLSNLFAHENIDRFVPDITKYNPKTDIKPQCESCNNEFDEKSSIRCSLKCHCNICMSCVGNWIKSKLSDEDILPYVRCPAIDCNHAIPLYLYYDKNVHLTTLELFQFANIYCYKHLSRNSNWFPCQTTKCLFGVVMTIRDDEKEVTCESCEKKYKYKRKHEMDEGFKQLLKEGKIRLCPVCQYPHAKDYGLCNVLQCGQCNIWWNWRTKDHATTSKELKQKARIDKSLWEPGELEYQMDLQKNNPVEFKAFLERNGITYDENYVRGQD